MVCFPEISFRNKGQLGGGGGTDPARIGEFEPRITSCGIVVGEGYQGPAGQHQHQDRKTPWPHR